MLSDAQQRLFELTRAGDVEGLRALLGGGISPNVQDAHQATPLEHAVRASRLDVMRVLLSFGAHPQAALFAALWSWADEAPPGAAPALTMLLDAGADPNWSCDGEPAIYLCAKHPELLRVLLEHGADPDRPTATGATALSFCCEWGLAASARVLLGRGANPNRTVPGLDWSMLFFAAASGHSDLVHTLLDAGANPKWVNARGQTALAVALEHRRVQIARALLARAPLLASLGSIDLAAGARALTDEPLAREIEALAAKRADR